MNSKCIVMSLAVALASLVAVVLPQSASAQPAEPAAVTVTSNSVGFVLDNGIVQALVSKTSGDLISLRYKGAEVLGTFLKENGTPDLDRDPPGDPGRNGRGMTDHMYGFWSHDTQADRVESKITIDPRTNNGDRAEVSVKGFSDGKKLGHGPGAPADGDFAADIEIRYTLGRGDSGVYTYCIFDHKPEYPNATMGEARFCAKLNGDFDWMLIDEHHNLYYPAEPESQGWDNKYNFTTVQWENPVFGFASVHKNVGFFIVNASVEYLTGPPTKVEFECHRDTNSIAAPCVLNYWRSSHYGGGGVDVAQGEAWTKVVGPFLLYVNSGSNPQNIWADAKAQQQKESQKWPYGWVSGVDYPHKDQRSTVSGQLVVTDPLAPPGASMSYLRVGLSHPDYTVTTGRTAATNAPSEITWQVDSKHYEFWVRGDNSGAFSIPNVRPGKYTLHAIADGILGEYTKTDITVEAGKPLDLGKLTWTPVRKGKQLWEIGIPNRKGSEYAGGSDYFHDNMAMVYSILYPDDLNFTIGKSDFHKDWFYLHPVHESEAAIATATVNAQPRPARGGFGGFGGRAGATTQPGGRGGAGNFARGGGRAGRGTPATQPAAAGAAAGQPKVPDNVLTRGAPGAQAPAAAGGRRGGFAAIPGGASARGAAGGSRPSPWNISFDLPTAPKGKATLRVGVAANNNANIAMKVNGADAGRLAQMPSDSSIGRNGIQGIWFEREVPFDASLMKQGTNTVTLTVSGGSIIYDYLRLELDESAN